MKPGRTGWLIAAQALVCFATPAAMAASGEQGALNNQERTGPDATPPQLPDFPTQQELRPNIIPPAVEPAPLPLPIGGAIIRDVRILADGDGSEAVPPRGWEPPADRAGFLRLDHQSGQPLDTAWVQAQFSRIVAGGAPISTAVGLTQLINRAFVTAGFVNSGLLVRPGTAAENGILEIQLVYGRLAAAESGDLVTVEWAGGEAAGLDEAYVRRRFPSAFARPLSAVDVERDFRLLAEDPAIGTVSAALRPGGRAGEASLHLLIQPEERFDVYVGAANDRSPSVGGERAFAGGFARSLFAAGDLLTAEAGLAEGVEDVTLGYALPFFDPQTTLSFRGSWNDAAVIDQPLIPLDIRAQDRSVQGGLTRRFINEPLTPRPEGGGWSPSRTLAGGLQVLWREQQSFLLGEPFSFAPGSVDGRSEYYAARLTGDYLARSVNHVLAFSLTGTIGIDGTRSDIPSIPNPSQNFKVLLAQLNYARRLNAGGLELRARLTGQLADSVLYSGERISIGGESSVRGYRENLFLADQALIGSIELAQPFSLTPARTNSRFDWGAFTVSAFVDGAFFSNVDVADPFKTELASTGASLAWTPSNAILARVTYGHALIDVPLGGSPDRKRDLQDRGFQFRIVIHPLRLFR